MRPESFGLHLHSVPHSPTAMSIDLDRKDSHFTDAESQYPPSLGRKPVIPLPRTITLPPDTGLPLSRQRHLTLQRTHSLGLTTGPSRADGPSRVVGEFRTLSIQVTHSQQIDQQERLNKGAIRDLASLDWHTISADDALQRFSVNRKIGLDTEQARRKLSQGGPNKVSPPPRNLFKKWLGYIFGGFGSLLLIASILCFIAWKPLGEPAPSVANLALAVVLLIVVILQTAFNAWQDYSTGRVMASITGMLPKEVVVIRDGHEVRIPAADLVPGDLVNISLGEKIPADIRFISVSSDLKIDKAVLTGESEPISGAVESTDSNILETRNIALAGTLCVSGSATGVVFQTGDTTVFGRIAKLSSTGAPSMTTLQREIFRFVIIIATIAISLNIIIIILWATWLNKKHKGFITVPVLIIDVVSVAVAFIPEGLPASVTISLSVIANTLGRNKVLCKSLMTVETLGAVNVLCSDKTGTLTKNVMTVTSACVFDTESTPEQARDCIVRQEKHSQNLQQLAAVAGICNAARFDDSTKDKSIGLRLIHGDATDSAILRFAEFLRPVSDSISDWEEVYKVNFNSKTKFMLKLLRLPSSSSKTLPAPITEEDEFNPQDYMLVCKGAPDVLLKRCTRILDPASNASIPLDDTALIRLTTVQEKWASQGQRVLLLARRAIRAEDIPSGMARESPEFGDHVNLHLNQDLTVIGLVGLVDPPRDDIPETVRIMRNAGIRFFMVTGDFALTAVAIARQCGIISNASRINRLQDLDRDLHCDQIEKYDADDADSWTMGLVLSGPDLMVMNEAQWEQACQYREIVFARTTPEQKLRIVKEFQSRGCIVGMTGDGVNDSPSLKAADVGIAMGGGSDVACEAADLILLESFSSIVVAVEYGRLVFDNLRKTCLYLLPAGSFSELMPVLLNVLLGLPQILSSLQMIIICAITDILPAIALCFERPEAGLLTRKPRNVKKDKLLDWQLLLQAYGFLGLLESLCAMSMSFWWLQKRGFPFSELVLAYEGVPSQFDPEAYLEAVSEAQSIYFFTLIGMQWGNLLATRTRRLSLFQHPFIGGSEASKNLWIIPSMLASMGFCFFFSYVPFFQRTFQTRGVKVEYIFLPLAFGCGLLMLDEGRKYCVRHWPKGLLAKAAW